MIEQATANESKATADGPVTLVLKVTIPALAIPDESGGYSVVVPALPGCYGEAHTISEAQANAVKAAEGWLASMHDRNRQQAPVFSAEFLDQLAKQVEPIAGEIAFYKEHLPKWAEHEGRHVLIKNSAVHGFYPTRDAALDAGYDRFGRVPFLVKEVLLNEQPQPLASLVR